LVATNPAAPPPLIVNPSSTSEEIHAPPMSYASTSSIFPTSFKCTDSKLHISWP
jgi:hypothetical protein